jgi:midasin (ATPase involved in ribosome maturation)
MKDLQRYRQGSKVFAGKYGFITLRDLFKWADRRPASYEELAQEGYMLLAERLRNPEEKTIVKVNTDPSLSFTRIYSSCQRIVISKILDTKHSCLRISHLYSLLMLGNFGKTFQSVHRR